MQCYLLCPFLSASFIKGMYYKIGCPLSSCMFLKHPLILAQCLLLYFFTSVRYTIFLFFLSFKNQEHIWSGGWPWPKFTSIYIDIESVVKKASKAKVRIYTYNTSSDIYTKAVSKAMLMLALLYPKRTMPILRPWWTCDLSLSKKLCFKLISFTKWF